MTFTIRPYEERDQDWLLQCEVALQEHELAIADPRLAQSRLPALPATHDYLKLRWQTLAEDQGVILIGEMDGVRAGLEKAMAEATAPNMETMDRISL